MEGHCSTGQSPQWAVVPMEEEEEEKEEEEEQQQHSKFLLHILQVLFNPLKPNDTYRRRTAPLTSKVAFYIFIKQI